MNVIASSPSWLSRNAKFVWAAAGVVLTVATDVVDHYAQVIPSGWLPVVQGTVLALTAVGVQRDRNAVAIEDVISMVQHVLPAHQLVALPSAADVLANAPVLATPTSVPAAPAVPVAPVADAVPTAPAVVAPTDAAPYLPSADVLAQVNVAPAAVVTAPTA